jgi:hypothetical protein
MESQAENNRLRALLETARVEKEYARRYSQFLERELAEQDGELDGKNVGIRVRNIELGNKDIEIA